MSAPQTYVRLEDAEQLCEPCTQCMACLVEGDHVSALDLRKVRGCRTAL